MLGQQEIIQGLSPPFFILWGFGLVSWLICVIVFIKNLRLEFGAAQTANLGKKEEKKWRSKKKKLLTERAFRETF